MPLSEHEQRLFEEIERSLAEDPKFASAVRAHDPRHHARRRLVLAAVALVAGLALLVYGAVSKNPLLGVCGFVVMLGAPAVVMVSHRRVELLCRRFAHDNEFSGESTSHAACATPAALDSYGYNSTVAGPSYPTSFSAAKMDLKSMTPFPGVRCW